MIEYNRIETDYFEALQYYEKDRYVTVEMWPGSDFIGHLKLTLRGREKTPYEGGKFIFELKAFETYPFYPPGVFCHTRIWHPNIDIDKPAPNTDLWKDNVCFDIINPERIGRVDPETHASGWTPAKDLTMIFECLKLMIHCYPPFFNADDPLNFDAGHQYREVRGVFNRKAAAWTRKYATGEFVAWDTWDSSPDEEIYVVEDDMEYEYPGEIELDYDYSGESTEVVIDNNNGESNDADDEGSAEGDDDDGTGDGDDHDGSGERDDGDEWEDDEDSDIVWEE